MSVKLLFESILKFILGVILVVLLIFIPANTIKYYNGWLFLITLFIPMFISGIIMMIRCPMLLKNRLNIKEKEPEQKLVLKLSGLMFLSGFIVAGLDYRFNWSQVPKIIVVIAVIIFLLSYVLYAEVLRENVFLSRTIEVQNNQKVIDSGLYGIVRHPMYAATLFLFLSMPLILGSFISFIIFLVYPLIISKRINNEEKVLEQDLEGYKEYKKKVKYKIIPFIW